MQIDYDVEAFLTEVLGEPLRPLFADGPPGAVEAGELLVVDLDLLAGLDAPAVPDHVPVGRLAPHPLLHPAVLLLHDALQLVGGNPENIHTG